VPLHFAKRRWGNGISSDYSPSCNIQAFNDTHAALASTFLMPEPAMAQLPKRPGLVSTCTCLVLVLMGMHAYNDYTVRGACGILNIKLATLKIQTQVA
jgi:hypothetical protein